ncbi:MAG: SDR family oxidoreductase [Chloroflexota bacterium]
MRYLVTGGAGFIGSHIVRALLEQGDFVRVLDNFSTGRKENLADLQIDLHEGDLLDQAAAASAVKDIDIIFHEAAFVSVPQSMQTPLVCFAANQYGTELLLESARQAGVKRVVLASSAAVYGNSNLIPLPEDTPLEPLSPYAVSKRVDELYAQLYTRSFGLEVAALRYFNVYGPRQRPDSMYAAAVPIFSRRLLDGLPITIYGDGGQTRDLIYVGDVVRANLAASLHPAAPGQIFNICTGHETSVSDLVEELRRLVPGSASPIFEPARAGDIYRSVGSPQKAASILGYQAKTDLAAGLKSVVDWMKSA